MRKPHQTYQLNCEKQDSLEAELAAAEIEEVFEGVTEKVKNYGIVIKILFRNTGQKAHQCHQQVSHRL